MELHAAQLALPVLLKIQHHHNANLAVPNVMHAVILHHALIAQVDS